MEHFNELSRKALDLLKQSKFNEAIEFLIKCKEINPFDPTINYNLGIAYEKTKNLKAALSEYFAAIENDYTDYHPYFRIGLINAIEENYNVALDFFDQALEISHENDEIIFNKATCYQDMGLLDKAIKEYTKAISLNDRSPKYFQFRAHCYFRSKKFDLAKNDFSEAISLNKFSIGSYFGRADSYMETNEIDRAISDYTKVLEINDEDIRALNQRGIALARVGRFDAAIDDFTKIALTHPDEIDCFVNLGSCYLQLGDIKKAIINYSKVIEKRSNDIECLVRRGMLLFLQKEYSLSFSDLGKAISIAEKKDYPIKQKNDVLYTLGLIKLERKNYNEAIEWFLKCNFDTYLVTLAKIIRFEFTPRIGTKLFKELTEFNEAVLEIKKLSLVAEEDVCHYTSLTVADKIITGDDNKLRYYNVAYMNDPEEGRCIFNLLNNEMLNFIKYDEQEEESNIYLGSFLPKNSNDELVMWRTYGKENNEEAKGCSIKIKKHFFDNSLPSTNEVNSQHLSKVIYVDKESGKIFEKNSRQYEVKFKKLHRVYTRISSVLNDEKISERSSIRAVADMLNLSLSQIKYLFKSADFSYENELRTIIVAPFDSNLVKIDTNLLPKKLFVESKKSIREFIQEIVLGPKVDEPSHWIYLKAILYREGNDVILRQSNVKFK